MNGCVQKRVKVALIKLNIKEKNCGPKILGQAIMHFYKNLFTKMSTSLL